MTGGQVDWSIDGKGNCPVSKPKAVIGEVEDNAEEQTNFQLVVKNPQKRKS